MKKILLFIGLLIMLFCFSYNVIASEDVKVTLDGQLIEFDVSPQIINGRTMVPIRAIFERMGASVTWIEQSKCACSTKDNITVNLWIGNDVLSRKTTEASNWEYIQMDCSPIIIDGRVLIPARYAAEAFGYTVQWDSASKTVTITDPIKDFINNVYYNRGPINMSDSKKNNLYIEHFELTDVEKNQDNTLFITCEISGTLYSEDSSNSFSYYAFYIDENWKTIGRSLLNIIGKGQFKKTDFLFDCPPQTKRIYISTQDPQLYKYVK